MSPDCVCGHAPEKHVRVYQACGISTYACFAPRCDCQNYRSRDEYGGTVSTAQPPQHVLRPSGETT